MKRLIAAAAIIAAAGCAHEHPDSVQSKPPQCFTEAGYLDSTNGCSERAGFPDCYLVCPQQGTRKRL